MTRVKHLQTLTKIKLFIGFSALVTLALYGYAVHYLIDAVNAGASDNRMALLAVIAAAVIASSMIGSQQLLMLWHRHRIKQLNRRFDALR